MSAFPLKELYVTELTNNDSSDLEGVGTYRMEKTTDGTKIYKYVKFNNGSGNVASATNMVVYYLLSDTDMTTVTNDVSDSDINQVAGVMPIAMTDLYYGWLQVAGPNAIIRTNGDDDIASSDTLIGGGDGTCNSVAQDTASTNKVLGYAVAADVDGDNTVAGVITVGLH